MRQSNSNTLLAAFARISAVGPQFSPSPIRRFGPFSAYELTPLNGPALDPFSPHLLFFPRTETALRAAINSGWGSLQTYVLSPPDKSPEIQAALGRYLGRQFKGQEDLQKRLKHYASAAAKPLPPTSFPRLFNLVTSLNNQPPLERKRKSPPITDKLEEIEKIMNEQANLTRLKQQFQTLFKSCIAELSVRDCYEEEQLNNVKAVFDRFANSAAAKLQLANLELDASVLANLELTYCTKQEVVNIALAAQSLAEEVEGYYSPTPVLFGTQWPSALSDEQKLQRAIHQCMTTKNCEISAILVRQTKTAIANVRAASGGYKVFSPSNIQTPDNFVEAIVKHCTPESNLPPLKRARLFLS
jgi:hypothetical protein